MHTYNDILINTFETMSADAEDKGKETFCITLSHEDAKIICKALNGLKPCQTEGLKVCDDTESRSPYHDTIDGMLSPDYKERFKAEYQQTKIRYEKLKAFNAKIEAAQLTRDMKSQCEEPKHDCPAYLLRDQEETMGRYLYILEIRAVIEGIELT